MSLDHLSDEDLIALHNYRSGKAAIDPVQNTSWVSISLILIIIGIFVFIAFTIIHKKTEPRPEIYYGRKWSAWIFAFLPLIGLNGKNPVLTGDWGGYFGVIFAVAIMVLPIAFAAGWLRGRFLSKNNNIRVDASTQSSTSSTDKAHDNRSKRKLSLSNRMMKRGAVGETAKACSNIFKKIKSESTHKELPKILSATLDFRYAAVPTKDNLDRHKHINQWLLNQISSEADTGLNDLVVAILDQEMDIEGIKDDVKKVVIEVLHENGISNYDIYGASDVVINIATQTSDPNKNIASEIKANLEPLPVGEGHRHEQRNQEYENRDSALWEKALVSADGDQNKAKAQYIKLRVKQLANAQNEQERKEEKQSAKNNTFRLLMLVGIFSMVVIVVLNSGNNTEKPPNASIDNKLTEKGSNIAESSTNAGKSELTKKETRVVGPDLEHLSVDELLAMGNIYYDGLDVHIDNIKAAEYYSKAAIKGSPIAQHALGDMYLQGLGVERSCSKAEDLYSKAAEQGLLEAQYALSDLYSSGCGVDQNDTEVETWTTKSEEKDSPAVAPSIGDVFNSPESDMSGTNKNNYPDDGVSEEKSTKAATKEKLSFKEWYKMQGGCRASEANPNPDRIFCINHRIRARQQYVLDELKHARFEVSSCINKALNSSPYPEQVDYEVCGNQEKESSVICISDIKKLKQDHRNNLATKYCGDLVLEDRRKIIECKRILGESACIKAIEAGIARAMRGW